MPIDTYLNQVVAIKSRTGVDRYAKPTFGASTDIEGRFVEKQTLLKDEFGKEYMTDAEIWVLPTQAIGIEDRITVSSVNYKVVKVETRRDIDGNVDHKKAYLMRTKE